MKGFIRRLRRHNRTEAIESKELIPYPLKMRVKQNKNGCKQTLLLRSSATSGELELLYPKHLLA